MRDQFIILVIAFSFLIHHFAGAQCKIDTKAFSSGEVITYKAYYNLGFLWFHAGDVEFKVTETNYKGQTVQHLYAYGSSHKSYDWIFTVREKYQAYIDKNTQMPLWYERDVTEGSYTAFEDYKFNYADKTIQTYVQKREDPGVHGSLPLSPCLFDVLSAIYYFRSVDFSKYSVGDKIPINMILDSQEYNLHIRYLGKEQVKTRDKKKFKCIKFAIQLVEGTIFKGDEDAVIWVTDDENKVPVIVEAKIIVGSVKAILNETKGLRSTGT